MTGEPAGVLLMAHGTPAREQDLPGFYTEIRRGSPPPPHLLQELADRYQAIGGLSPLAALSEAQRAGVAAALQRRGGDPVVVVLGNRFADPRIEEAMERLVGAGCRRVAGVVLAPHSSAVSVGEYRRRALAAAGSRLAIAVVDRWHLHPGLVALLAARVRAAVDGLPAPQRQAVVVVCTAHSVPRRVVDTGEDYPDQVRATAAAVLAAARVPGEVAFQSAGRTADPWVGPDLLQVLRSLPAAGARAVVVCPVGFVSDHLEVLYDLDIEARQAAASVGLGFARTASLNDDPAFCDVVADVARAALAGTPVAGTSGAGTPVPGTSGAGTPAAGTPVSDIAVPGIPASGGGGG